MANKHYTSRLTSDSMGSLLFNKNQEATKAGESAASEFENLFQGLGAPMTLQPGVMQPEEKTEPIPAPIVEEAEEKQELQKMPEETARRESVVKKGSSTQSPKEKKSRKTPVERDNDFLTGKRGRKKVYQEERITIFAKCGKICFDKVTELRYADKKPANAYLCDLLQKEKEAYEKNPEGYAANRRKKAEALHKMDKGADASTTFKVNKELANFLDDMVYEIRCSKELFIRTIVDVEYDRKFK